MCIYKALKPGRQWFIHVAMNLGDLVYNFHF